MIDDKKPVVSNDDSNGLSETMQIMQNPAHKRIVKGIESIKNGEAKRRQLLEE